MTPKLNVEGKVALLEQALRFGDYMQRVFSKILVNVFNHSFIVYIFSFREGASSLWLAFVQYITLEYP